jgi:hypothetical protein
LNLRRIISRQRITQLQELLLSSNSYLQREKNQMDTILTPKCITRTSMKRVELICERVKNNLKNSKKQVNLSSSKTLSQVVLTANRNLSLSKWLYPNLFLSNREKKREELQRPSHRWSHKILKKQLSKPNQYPKKLSKLGSMIKWLKISERRMNNVKNAVWLWLLPMSSLSASKIAK